MKAAFAALLLLPLLARAEDASATACRTHLKHLGGAIMAYQLIHDKRPPTKLADLYLDGLTDRLSDFVCPASGTSIAAASEIDTKSDYELGAGNELVREKTPHHGGSSVLTVFTDGTIKPVATAAAPSVATPQAPTTAATTPPPPSTVAEEQPLPPMIAPHMTKPGTTQPMTPPAPPLGSRPVGAYLGARVADVQNGKGAYVVELVPDSPAVVGGLKAGDVIMAVNGDPIDTSRQLVDKLAKCSPGGKLDLLVWRDAKLQKLSFFLGERPANY